ncbi:peptidoglycan recognition protein family protein [Spongiactinospora rosea]|uniref:peptidoglycan recognition protein family protein n=1 Tax=Spongiactinospora rosea TaxID=2248750 RepID=UPI001314A0D2|nr:peptidoglycan recognition family protein [Spongiactinospora rosea]
MSAPPHPGAWPPPEASLQGPGALGPGRAGLAGPLSHFGLGRSGRIYVIAAGRCWHNAPSTSAHHTNSASIGIEAENNGSQPWPAGQLDAYRKLCAEPCNAFDLPASRVRGHKEVNREKPDPHHIDMNTFRAEVARRIKGENDVSAKELWTHELASATRSRRSRCAWTSAATSPECGSRCGKALILITEFRALLCDQRNTALRSCSYSFPPRSEGPNHPSSGVEQGHRRGPIRVGLVHQPAPSDASR